MTKKQLVKIIKEIVIREVKKEVNEIFIIEKRLSKSNSKKTKPIVEKKYKKPTRKEHTTYTKNTALNDILNETANMEMDEYPTMGGGTFDSSRMTEMLGYGDVGVVGNGEVAREMGAVQTIKDAGLSIDQVPEDIVNAMTRDYSGLMKVINKKGK